MEPFESQTITEVSREKVETQAKCESTERAPREATRDATIEAILQLPTMISTENTTKVAFLPQMRENKHQF